MKHHARFLSACIGMISLSSEILWVKLTSFAHHSLPQAFSIVLAIFLLGIALGAHIGKRFCKTHNNLIDVAILALLVSASVDLLSPLLYAEYRAPENSYLLIFILALLSSASKSVLFPIAHHLGTDDNQSKMGSSVSVVYFFNIIGSFLGPIVIGFYALDKLSLQQCFMTIGVVSALLAMYLSFCFSRRLMPVCLLLTALGFSSLTLPESTLHKIISAEHVGERITHLIENRHGVIFTLKGPYDGDSIFGQNVYDGKINTDLVVNSNGIHRVYLATCLAIDAKKILVIGLSGGAWTSVLQTLPKAEKIDVVEINKGYIELIKQYPHVAPILDDRRTEFHIGDGRRWLNHHQTSKYDLVVMNTTWHWRAYTSLLLSADFLEIIKTHLNPGGIVAYNSTGSRDVLKTASSVFTHAYRYDNFIFASMDDFRNNKQHCQNTLRQLNRDGQPALDFTNKKLGDAVEALQKLPFFDIEQVQASGERPYEVITDQNMLTEYKYGKGWH